MDALSSVHRKIALGITSPEDHTSFFRVRRLGVTQNFITVYSSQLQHMAWSFLSQDEWRISVTSSA